MRRTLQEQSASNRRMSVVFMFLMILLLAGLGTVIWGVYSPKTWYYGAAAATALGAIVSLIAFTNGPSIILSISHARPATEAEDRVLRNVTEEMAIAAGIPLPEIYVIEDDSPNAFATGKDPQHGIVCVTTGLMRRLDRDELQGVIAHEMAHIRNYDIRFMTIVGLVAGLIPLLADWFRTMMWYGGGRRSRDRDDSNSQMIFVVIGLILSIVAPIFALLLQFAISRKREYLADSTAAELTRYPEGLARALQKIASDPEPLEAANRATQHMYIINPLQKLRDGSNLFSTHPPTEERIRALMGLMGTYEGNPLPETGTETGAATEAPPIQM